MAAHTNITNPQKHADLQPSHRPTAAISMGDPLGIGAEIICKALADDRLRSASCYRIYGARWAMNAAAKAAGITPFWQCAHRENAACGNDVLLIDTDPEERDWALAGAHGPTRRGGELSFRWVEDAIRDALRAPDDPLRADAIVTAPISKTSWNLAGETRYPGHTELLAERFGAPRSGMLFVGPHLRVMLATIHVPLMSVGKLLTIERVLEAIELAHEGCSTGILPSYGTPGAHLPGQNTGASRPRIAVCGLNPHAGEGGVLGSEDARIIAPAVAQARAKGIDAYGPLPGDTVFNAAAARPVGKGAYDCVVAMYHDQGLIPVKLVDRELAVNVTVGLPTIRTSPAHGTAFDIAGKNMASETSMRAAIELAIDMVARKRGGAALR